MISKDDVLLIMNFVNCKFMNVPTLGDSGSNLSLLTHRCAKNLGYKE